MFDKKKPMFIDEDNSNENMDNNDGTVDGFAVGDDKAESPPPPGG